MSIKTRKNVKKELKIIYQVLELLLPVTPLKGTVTSRGLTHQQTVVEQVE